MQSVTLSIIMILSVIAEFDFQNIKYKEFSESIIKED